MATIKVQVEIVNRPFLIKDCLGVLAAFTEVLVVFVKQLTMRALMLKEAAAVAALVMRKLTQTIRIIT
jgi:hypothetical protein